MVLKRLLGLSNGEYLEDPEEEMERMNHPHTEMVNRLDPRKAEADCRKIAKANGYKLTDVKRRPDGRHDCHFE